MFQKLLANKHHRLRDSQLSLVRLSEGLARPLDSKKIKNKNKARVDYEPHSVHGRAVNKGEGAGGRGGSAEPISSYTKPSTY